jgi:type III secretion protein C
MTTKIRVPDRHFVLLSGTMVNNTVRNVAGIPCLGGLPLIGAAFSKTEKTVTNRNVIMFIKPHIIHSSHDFNEITKQQEAIFSQEGQCNIQDFSQGLELGKSSSDENEMDDNEDDYDD